ncbi:MAG: GGDEF domain-containing protein [Streptomyces sp.]|jgi:diguanylate cyclase (GGDEF)-like protein|nr:GGDEF domain-containing protein [Streptomyces sp.]
MPAIALAAAMLICGHLLGRICVRSRCRRLRNDLATAQWLAEHDLLTGLLNRAGAERHYETQTAAGRVLTAVLIDLDGFKAVNDTWGHHVGDAELVAVAERLAAECVPLGAVATRLAGDEFLLLVPDADPDAVHEVQAAVKAVLTRLSAPITLVAVDALQVSITPGASAGIALAEADGTWAVLLRCADIALYQAKTVGGRAVLYTPGMQQPSRRDVRGTRLRDAALANYA